MSSLVSIIIPAFNRASTLPRALRSVLLQDYTNFEVIVVDDASSDDTWEVIKKYENIDARVKGIKLEHNLGPAGARNTGVFSSSGEFIAFLDSDDEWMPGKLKAQVEFLLNFPNIDVVFTDSENNDLVFQLKQKRSQVNGEFLRNLSLVPIEKYPGFYILEGNYRQELYRKYFILISSVLMRRSSFYQIGGFSLSRFGTEDIDFFVRIAKFSKFAYWSEITVSRFQDASGISWISERWLRELLDYHTSCLRSEEYKDLRQIAITNIKKTFGSLLIYYGSRRDYHRILSSFLQSIKYGLSPRLCFYFLLSLSGPRFINSYQQLAVSIRKKWFSRLRKSVLGKKINV